MRTNSFIIDDFYEIRYDTEKDKIYEIKDRYHLSQVDLSTTTSIRTALDYLHKVRPDEFSNNKSNIPEHPTYFRIVNSVKKRIFSCRKN